MRAFVVGGSSGLGAAIVDRLLTEEHHVHTLQRRPGYSDRPEHWTGLDLRLEPQDILERVAVTAHKWQPDALVVAGGVGAFTNPLLKAEQLNEMVATNFTGPAMVFQGVLRAWVAKQRYRMGDQLRCLYLGSTATRNRATEIEVYAATKAAGEKYYLEVGRRYVKWGVRANVLSVGWCESPMTQAIKPDLWERILRRVALRRPAQPSEVAAFVLRLLEAPDYFTGDRVELSGGL